MKLFTFLLIFFFIYNMLYSQSDIQRAKKQSEDWAINNVFPYFESARFLTKEENNKYKIENNFTVFEGTQIDPKSFQQCYCYSVTRNGSLLLENTLCDYGDELYNYFKDEYEKTSIYADTIKNQITEYLGPIKNTIYFVPPTQKIPKEIKTKMLLQNKALCLAQNVNSVNDLGLSHARHDIDCHSKFYTYNLYFTFINQYTKNSPQINIMPIIVFLNEDIDVQNKEIQLSRCNDIK